MNISMKKVMLMASMVLVAGTLVAAENEQPNDQGERRGPPPREGMMPGGPGMMMGPMNNANWFGRFLEKEENLDKLGVKDEARAKLVKELGDINNRMKEIQQKIREASMEQAKLAKDVMEKPGADVGPVLEKVKAIGDLRTEQSMLSTKVLVVVRDNLTKEQRDQVRELVMKEGRQRMEARREFNGRMEGRRPEFGNGENRPQRRRPRQEGEDAPKPDAEK